MPTPLDDATDNWVDPRTWTTGEFVAASDFQELRDDLLSMGDQWRSFTPSFSNLSAVVARSVYSQAGRYITVSQRFTNLNVTGFMAIDCPFISHSAYVGGAGGDVLGTALAYDGSATAFTLGAVIFNTGSHSNIVFQNPTGPATWNASNPFVWDSLDTLTIKYRYEAA